MAKAAENEAAKKMVGQCRSIDIDRNDIIMGLADIAMSGSTPAGARVSAWLGLADMFSYDLRKLKTSSCLQDGQRTNSPNLL